ncbi:hypothetical protein CVS40_8307 [Lucilia cuprina]|nr:hypothetical protein CVS40_8307 [Lucilia cuprina]
MNCQNNSHLKTVPKQIFFKKYNMNTKNKEKKIERISKYQKEKLVDYMSENLEFARGKFSGISSNFKYKEQWQLLTESLNSLGGCAKTVEQWKKCWIDLKSGVKKSVNARRKFINQTGGGSWSDVPRDLNPLEEKILAIITIDAVDGDASTPEAGVEFKERPEDSVDILESEETFLSPSILSTGALSMSSTSTAEVC